MNKYFPYTSSIKAAHLCDLFHHPTSNIHITELTELTFRTKDAPKSPAGDQNRSILSWIGEGSIGDYKSFLFLVSESRAPDQAVVIKLFTRVLFLLLGEG